MKNLISKKATLILEEHKTDVLDEHYVHRILDYLGNKIEINEDRYGFHAKANDDNSTMKVNMNGDDLINWLRSLFG